MKFENIKMEVKDKVAWITLNRIKAMNALNVKMLQEIGAAIEEINKNKEICVGILTGAGDKAFSAGADLNEITNLTIKSAFDYSRLAHNIFRNIEESEKPIIASINGMAMGGGAELALCCHIKIAAENAKISFPEAGLGGIPGMGGTQRLPKLIGKARALMYLLTGESISANEALQFGLFQKVVPLKELINTTEKIAEVLIKKSPLSIKFIIQAVMKGTEMPLEEGLVLESAFMAALTESEDKREGIKAIFEKRAPVFKR